MDLQRLILLPAIVGTLFAMGLAACGGNDDDETIGSANVVDLTLNDSVLEVGGGAIVSVKFSFSSENVFDDNDSVDVVVRLPSTVSFRAGTAEIKRSIDDRDVNPDTVLSCAGGGSFVSFRFDEDELTDAENPSGDADAELRFTVDAVAAGATATIDAAAQNNGLTFNCSTGIPVQAGTVVDVTA